MAGRRIAAAVTLSLCLVAAAHAAQGDELARAEKLIDSLRYAEAAKALDAARARPGNPRETLLRILELQGIVAGSLGRAEQARSVFRLLLSLEPGFSLKGKYSPKVTTPFYEAKGWAAEHGGLRFEPAPPVLGQGTVDALTARVMADPLKAGEKVRFHVQEDGAEPREVESPLENGLALAEVKGAAVRWWAELLGSRAEVLAQVGTAEAPLSATAAASGGGRAGAGPGIRLPLRTMSYVALGGAALSLGAGGFFGVQSFQARGRLEGAEKDELGRVVGLTQREALMLEQRSRDSAVVANVLFGTGGALAVAGAVLWVTGGSPAPVAVVPTGNGFAISGVLP
jgi:hypothetical protein